MLDAAKARQKHHFCTVYSGVFAPYVSSVLLLSYKMLSCRFSALIQNLVVPLFAVYYFVFVQTCHVMLFIEICVLLV